MNVLDYRVHPEFSDYYLTNDVAMLRLERHLFFSRSVALIGMAYSEYFYTAPKEVFVSGWGSILVNSVNLIESFSSNQLSNIHSTTRRSRIGCKGFLSRW